MDTAISAGQAARVLHTSVPRVIRAIDRLGLDVQRRPAGQVMLGEADLEALRTYLGRTPKVGALTRTETKVLAALARSPLGLASVRAVARRAGASPTAAGRALRGLVARALVREERRLIAAGRTRLGRVFRVDPRAPGWAELATALAGVVPPAASTGTGAEVVPPRLRHLVWNVAPAQLALEGHGAFIARRLLQGGDLEGLAWGAAHLSAEDWAHAARARGLKPDRIALARNLAAAGR